MARIALDGAYARIAVLDDHIKAFVRLNEDSARSAASELDDRAYRHNAAGALYGFTVGVKDTIDTEGLETTCGSPIMEGRVPAVDADVVSQAKAAWATIVGKTATTEWAAFDPALTRNPWRFSHTPGGSSSGSAAAVAAGMVRVALGTQTAGSVIRPAAYCGVVGYVPSPQLLSIAGVYPCSWTLDRVGIFARSVDDATRFARALYTHHPPETANRLGTDSAERGRPIRIGILSGILDHASSAGSRAVRLVAKMLSNEGYDVQSLELPPSFGDGFAAHAVIMRAEVAAVHRQTYQTRRRDYAANISTMIEAGRRIRALDYVDAQRTRRKYREHMRQLLLRVDAMLLPSAKGPADRGLVTTGDPIMSIPATFAGLPAITIPVSLARGLPVGVQLVSGSDRDTDLLAVAREAERLVAFDVDELPRRLLRG